MIGQTISHYKIIEELGSGGMGTVYKAQDTRLDRFVALKFLPPHLSQAEEEKKRFIHEAKAASALDHPNICSIYEIDETADGQMFIAMACYEGESLKDKIDRGPLQVEEALNITIQIARGLEKAHAKGIIHRDIKPANILITDDGQVKIIDFGLAKLKGRTILTKAGTTLGTVAYMSPEQTKGAKVDQRTDIWALGVMLYEMLAGENPFKGDYEQAVMYSIVNEDPEFITKLRSEVPAKMERILEKALAKNPDKRFQTTEEMLEELKNTVEELKEGRRQKQPLYRLGRKQRRTVSRILSVILVIIIFGVYLWLSQISETKPISIALLPLVSITPNAEQEWFTDGITDALITNLARISGLRVISRSAVMKYKGSDKTASDIAEDLGISYLIEGSVIRVGEQINVNTRLIDAASNDYLWAQEFKRDYKDILSLQGEVARSIAGQIRVKLTPYEQNLLSNKREVNPKAYDAYLKGNFYWSKLTPQDLETALKYYELATELDPEYALGYAGIALVWLGRAQNGYVSYDVASAKAKPAAAKALELDSTLAEVQSMMGGFNAWLEWNWEQSVTAYEKAIKFNPSLAEARAYYSHVLFFLNHPEDGMKQIELALELDPFNSLFQALYAMDLMYIRRYDDAIETIEKIRQTAPRDPVALSTLKSAYHQKQMYQEALEIWRFSFEIHEDHEAIQALNRGNDEGGYSVALQRVAEIMIERSKTRYVTPWQIATLYTRAGMNDEAIKWFEKAFTAHDNNMPYLSVDPIFDSLRDDPRFKNLVKRMGLKS
jgi:serine/threonine protein kinase/Tfp pilus assembly protein PilF